MMTLVMSTALAWPVGGAILVVALLLIYAMLVYRGSPRPSLPPARV